ncbi:MAG: hypothetical protein MJD61_20305 [Proteobacteria bacterium]|nr:hypothetical protein [Pseudomonadota bacterium]
MAEQAVKAALTRLRARGVEALVSPPSASPPSERNNLKRAADAYMNLRPQAAVTQLDAMLTRLHSNGGAGITRSQLLEALLLRAMAESALGRLAQSQLTLDRIHAIDPSYQPSPAQYPPNLRKSLARRRSRHRAGSTVLLILAGLPPSAMISLDAKPLGTFHVLAAGRSEAQVALTPGVHLVRAFAPGRIAAGTAVTLHTDHRLVLELPPDPTQVLRHAGEPRPTVPTSVHSAARSLGATPLLVDYGRDQRARPVLSLLDTATGRKASRILGRGATLEATADLLVAQLLRAAPPLLDQGAAASSRGSPVTPWLIAGGAVAIAAGAVVFVAFALDDEPSEWAIRGTIERP